MCVKNFDFVTCGFHTCLSTAKESMLSFEQSSRRNRQVISVFREGTQSSACILWVPLWVKRDGSHIYVVHRSEIHELVDFRILWVAREWMVLFEWISWQHRPSPCVFWETGYIEVKSGYPTYTYRYEKGFQIGYISRETREAAQTWTDLISYLSNLGQRSCKEHERDWFAFWTEQIVYRIDGEIQTENIYSFWETQTTLSAPPSILRGRAKSYKLSVFACGFE